MILHDNLYTIKHSDANFEGDYSATLWLNDECEIYRAHFPGKPITPGVCIIQIISELVEHFIGAGHQLAIVRNAKFKTVIDPELTPELQVDMSIREIEPRRLGVSATVRVEGKVSAVLSLIYTA